MKKIPVVLNSVGELEQLQAVDDLSTERFPASTEMADLDEIVISVGQATRTLSAKEAWIYFQSFPSFAVITDDEVVRVNGKPVVI